MKSISEFRKTKDFLICFDSDGCVMDTMTSKHERCFGPALIETWGLERWEREILDRWCEINLYSQTRGINRYRGLALILGEINAKYVPINGIDCLTNWVNNSDELSIASLKQEIEENPDAEILKNTLRWSIKSNLNASRLPSSDKLPFPSAREAVEISHHHADVAIVSSADPSALIEEWDNNNISNMVDVILSQKDGSKSDCLNSLLKKGYSKDHVIMCGDSPGDLAASESAGVFFFPIIFNKEKKSWDEFIFKGLPMLISDGYGGEYQKRAITEFKENLEKEKKYG